MAPFQYVKQYVSAKEMKKDWYIVKLPKWFNGQMVEIIDETDDPDWPERFGRSCGVIIDAFGKYSRWVLVKVLSSEFKDAVGSYIRFPKSTLKPTEE